MADKFNIVHKEYLNERDSNVIQKNSAVDVTPVVSMTVICNIFDSTQNFIKQKVFKYTDYDYNFTDEKEFLNFLKNEILEINSENEDSLNPGKYQISFEFIDDIFGVSLAPMNKFIVTELSPDRTEVRLSPMTSEEDLLNVFNDFRIYKKTDKIVYFRNLRDYESYIPEFVSVVFDRSFIDSLFSVDIFSLDIDRNNYEINYSSFYSYILTIFRRKIQSDLPSLSSSQNFLRAKRMTDIKIEELKSNYISYKLEFERLLGIEYRNNFLSDGEFEQKIQEANSDEEFLAISDDFKDFLYNFARENITNSIIESSF